ncbi:MAG TPA: hypothetical protein VIE45_11685 [Streptosporangiaceae bacterium]|jgi:hypothetical protein
MNVEVEELLRDGMERFTAEVRAPQGLVSSAAGGLRRRRMARRAMVAGGAVTATAAAVIIVTAAAGGTPARTGSSLAQARETAYIVTRVENALASEHGVYHGVTMSTDGQPSVTWAYGRRSRFEEFTGRQCGHVLAPSGECTHAGGSERYLAQGTALVKGKLTEAYVTYFDQRYSLSRYVYTPPSSACGKAAMEMGGPAPASSDWPAFVKATLACGGARVTGHVRINGVPTTKITGKPVTVRLSRGYGKVVHEKYARVLWTLYVDPQTYLPVRMIGVTETFGGSGGPTRFASATSVRWLPPTAANRAKALVTIPPGYHQVSSAANQ